MLLPYSKLSARVHQDSWVLLHCTTAWTRGSGGCNSQDWRGWSVLWLGCGPVVLLVLRAAVVVPLLTAVTPVLSVREGGTQCSNRGEWWHYYYRSNYQQNIKMEYWVMSLLDCKTVTCKMLKFWTDCTTHCAAGKWMNQVLTSRHHFRIAPESICDKLSRRIKDGNRE